MNDSKTPWQTPTVEQLDVAGTLGLNLPNADGSGLANTAFPNPS